MPPADRRSYNGSPASSPGGIESPFIAAMTYAREQPGPEGGGPEPEGETLTAQAIESPFRITYELEEPGGMDDPNSEALAEFLAEIHDEEFDEALAELANEAATLVETRLSNGGKRNERALTERMLQQHFAPLETAIQQMFESANNRLEGQNPAQMTEGELRSLLEASQPSMPEATPAFEYFFGKLVDKVKKVATSGLKLVKKGVGALATLGLGPVLKQLARLARPLIKRVLQMAINKLPAPLQPVAQKLARRFLGETADDAAATDLPIASPAAEIQYEFDLQVAELFFAPPELEGELSLAEYESQVSTVVEDPVDELAHARQRFVHTIQQLQEGEDPAPAVENFIPAILPALKLGLKVAGRERVVNLLSRVVGKLIGRFVGRKYTPPLARAMVDAGLRLLNLEASPEDANLAAGEAVALAVEETVRRTTALPDYVLENEALLEGFVVQAFEMAAAANLPPVLPETVYQRRPDLRESSGPAGAWVLLPRGQDGHRYYQKYTRIFQNIPLPPHVAAAVKTFGGRPLSAFLRDSLGMQTNPGLTARIHVYEAIPGTWLSRIARWERGVPGLNGTRHAWRMLHPLTTQAAGLLLGQPALGREMPLDARSDPATVEPGERFYYLEIPGARPQATPASGGQPGLRRSSDIRLELDFSRGQVRAYVYLSESDAQEMAVRLRQGAPAATVLTGLNSLLDTTLRDIFSSGLYSKVKINHRVAMLWPVSGYALKRLSAAVLERFRHQLIEWLGRALADFFGSRSQTFVGASEDPADGVTLTLTLDRVPGLEQLDRLLLGQNVGPTQTVFPGGQPDSGIQVRPGYAHG